MALAGTLLLVGLAMMDSTRPKAALLAEPADGYRRYVAGGAVVLLGFGVAAATLLGLVP